MSKKNQRRGLAPHELRDEGGQELPDRHAMSLISGSPGMGGDVLGMPLADSPAPTDGTSQPPADTTPAPGPEPQPGPETTTSSDGGGGTAPPSGPIRETPGDYPIVTRETVIDRITGGSQGAGAGQNAPINQSN
jgi:hypothetical protein